jgi:hypothetical protein
MKVHILTVWPDSNCCLKKKKSSQLSNPYNKTELIFDNSFCVHHYYTIKIKDTRTTTNKEANKQTTTKVTESLLNIKKHNLSIILSHNSRSLCVCVCVCVCVLIKPHTLCMLGKCYTTEVLSPRSYREC